jgi:hypothetical protein
MKFYSMAVIEEGYIYGEFSKNLLVKGFGKV